ncbi:MAG: hypothetical protein OHK0023_03950 [Anaerolineae bacterium]
METRLSLTDSRLVFAVVALVTLILWLQRRNSVHIEVHHSDNVAINVDHALQAIAVKWQNLNRA